MRRLSKAEIRAIQPLIEEAVNKAMRVPPYRRNRPAKRRRATAVLKLDLQGAIVTDDLIAQMNKIAEEHGLRDKGLRGLLRRIGRWLSR